MDAICRKGVKDRNIARQYRVGIAERLEQGEAKTFRIGCDNHPIAGLVELGKLQVLDVIGPEQIVAKLDVIGDPLAQGQVMGNVGSKRTLAQYGNALKRLFGRSEGTVG